MEPAMSRTAFRKYTKAMDVPYQLPNSTAHNETCANIGNMLFNWRMLEVTGDAKYADIVETALYDSVLSGVSLDGKKYFYTNRCASVRICHTHFAGLKNVPSISAASVVRLIRCAPFVKPRTMLIR